MLMVAEPMCREELEIRLSSVQGELELGLGLSLAIFGLTNSWTIKSVCTQFFWPNKMFGLTNFASPIFAA